MHTMQCLSFTVSFCVNTYIYAKSGPSDCLNEKCVAKLRDLMAPTKPAARCLSACECGFLLVSMLGKIFHIPTQGGLVVIKRATCLMPSLLEWAEILQWCVVKNKWRRERGKQGSLKWRGKKKKSQLSHHLGLLMPLPFTSFLPAVKQCLMFYRHDRARFNRACMLWSPANIDSHSHLFNMDCIP